MQVDLAFWQYKTLSQLTEEEWESLCDGCGKCCLHKLEDEDTGDVYYTQVACQLLDLESCQCSDYRNRLSRVPGCLNLRPEKLEELVWLPNTCAYRLVAEGKPLPYWHHLVSGNRQSIHQAQQSVRGRVLEEGAVLEEEMEEHIIYWVDDQSDQ